MLYFKGYQSGTCIWFVKQRYGRIREEIPVFTIFVDGKHYEPISYRIICPRCGNMWAKREVIAPKQQWHCFKLPCFTSLWIEHDESWNASLGPRLLRQELKLLAKEFQDGKKD